MEELKISVAKLISEELERANKEFPLFNSTHEGYAVMKEEIEESEEELFKINNQLIKLWQDVKTNYDKCALQHSDLIKKHAVLLACEAIQVAAMAQKFQDSYRE